MQKLLNFNITKFDTTLSSGTKVVLFNRPKMPIVISALFLAGSRFDPVGLEGTAHFLEHMLLAGTKEFPTKDKLASYIEGLGGNMGAYTGSDCLDVYASVAEPLDIKAAIKILSEELRNPLFDEKTIETERGAILRELSSAKTSPTRMLGMIEDELIFQDTLVGRSTIGTEESINKINKEVLIDFYKKHITANSLVITIAGDISMETIEKLFENSLILKTGEKPDLSEDLKIIRNRYYTYEFFKGDSLNLSISFRTTNYHNPESNALRLLSGILGGGRASILTKKLRYEKGLVYHVGAGNSSNEDNGVFGIGAALSKDKIDEVMQIIGDEIKKIKEKGPTEEDLSFIKNKWIKSKKMSMQTSGSWVDFHEYSYLFDKDTSWTIEDYIKETESVTKEDIKNVANRYLNENNFYVAATGEIDEAFMKGIKIDL